MTFTLYDYVLSGNCYKIRLFAGLLGVEYKSVAVDFYPGFEHRGETMRALNPAGTLPVMETAEGVLTQSADMLTWMAKNEAGGEAWITDEVAEWMAFADRLTDSIGLARLHAMLDWPVDGPAVLAQSRLDLRELEVRLTDRVLLGKTWLVGEGPSIADVACFPYVALSPDAGLEHDGFPAIRSWLHAVRGLKGFVTMPGIHARHDLRTPPPSEQE